VPFDPKKVCMDWTWYLRDDMVFFIVALLIIPIYQKRQWMGWLVLLLLSGLSVGITVQLVLKNHLGLYVFDHHYEDYAYWAYSRSYTRVPAYFVGMAAAWSIRALELRGITRDSRPYTLRARLAATVVACLSAVGMLAIVFLPSTDFGLHKNSWNKQPLLNALYIALSRPLWAALWAAITLLCYYGYLPLVDGFLAHPLWTPFARLTYGAYLVHPLIIMYAGSRTLQFLTFSTMNLTYHFVGNCVIAFLASALLWALVERPCMTIFTPGNATRKTTDVNKAAKLNKKITRQPSGQGSEILTDYTASTTASQLGSEMNDDRR